MSDVLYVAALLMMFIGLFSAMRQRNKFRDKAHEAEFTVSLQKIEIAHLREQLEVKNAQT